MPGELFALVSSRHIQLNALFTYIDTITHTRTRTRCDKHKHTCFSHAGTYLTNTGISIWPATHTQPTHVTLMLTRNNASDWQMSITTGTSTSTSTDTDTDDDMSASQLDMSMPATYIVSEGQLLDETRRGNMTDTDDATHSYIRVIDTHHVRVHVCGHMTIGITLSPDGFLDLSLLVLQPGLLAAGAHRTRILGAHDTSEPAAYPSYQLHGLIGQTWRNAVYVTAHGGVRYYEGSIDDYIVCIQPVPRDVIHLCAGACLCLVVRLCCCWCCYVSCPVTCRLATCASYALW